MSVGELDLAAPDRAVVFVDADNTLWDTNVVYAKAQLTLLSAVEEHVGRLLSVQDRLAWLRAIDQTIAERHHANLRYPPRLLAKATALALTGHNVPTAARLAWSGGPEGTRMAEQDALRIEERFLDDLRNKPPLRPGVRRGLQRLKSSGCMTLVLTEDSRSKTLALIAHHKIEGLVDRVIEARKQERVFERVMSLIKKPLMAFMIGDQLDRDIQPAQRAGVTTVYFPGGFRPKWNPRESEAAPDYKVRNLDDAASIILEAVSQFRRDA